MSLRMNIAATAVVAILAIALTALVAAQPHIDGEAAIVREIQTWPVPDGFADAVRAMTTTSVVLVCGVLLCVALWFAGARREATALAVALLLLAIVQPLIKDVVDRPRPAEPEVEIRATITSESFPAGHVMSPTVLYVAVLWLSAQSRWPRMLRLAAAAWASVILVATGVVNLYLGVHWPTDVFGGYAWGATLGLAPLIIAAATKRDRAPLRRP